MTISRTIARPLLASMFVMGAVNAFKNSSGHAIKAKPVTDRLVPLLEKVAPQAPIPHDPETLVRINAGAQLLAGLGLATGRAPRLSGAVLAGSLIPTTFAGHRYWEESDPAMKANQRIHFFKNLSMLGGLLLASVDTEGQPGVAWRARRAAADVRREARHLRKTAKLEARLARKSVG